MLRFVHDEGLTLRPEAATLGAFVALRILERWALREGEIVAFFDLRRREAKAAYPVRR